jgi:outer membrane receptor protein involved in Fe transport
MVYKISDGFRISYAMQLPSISWITEKFAPRVVSDFIGFNYPGVGPLGKSDVNWFENEYSYKMRLPARHRLGFTYIEGKKGMAGLELEYADMSAARLSEGDGNYNFREENAIVSNQYRPTLSVKAGGEICFENLRFRAGYAFLPGALASGAVFSDNVHGDAHYFTGGLGGRYDVWYWDAALVYGVWKTRYNFLPAVMDDVVIQASSTQLRMGVGFYF